MRSRCRTALNALLVLAALSGGRIAPATADDAAPAGGIGVPRVVLRGKTDLADALRAAIRAGGTTPPAVAFVVDATPYVAGAEDRIVDAVMRIAPDLHGVRSWSAAGLGELMAAGGASSGTAALRIAEALRRRSGVANTMIALRTTLDTFTDRGGVVVYLADWHFEDDHGTEELISALRARGQTLSVVGSEAAFSRAWNDGLDWDTAARSPGGLGDPRIGRNPFGGRDREAPWHGGETAWPAHPAYWNGAPWASEFTPDVRRSARTVEDLRERLDGRPVAPDTIHPHPLPSSFGPWGLMRAAGETGGRYVLWSWNPRGRSDVTYDWSRCDLFAPDLRPRGEIHADLARRPLAQAIVHAWNLLVHPSLGLAAVTPPLGDDFDAEEMSRSPGGDGVRTSWANRDQYRTYLRAAPEALARMDDVLARLDRAVAAAQRSLDDADRRLLADVHMLRHVVRVQRHSLGEGLAEAKQVPDAWFSDREKWVGMRPIAWTEPGADPEAIRADFELLRDAERGRAALDDRAAMLRRYAGTPWGESVARNRMYVWRAEQFERGDANARASRSPAESSPTPPPATPGGSSGAPGPSTGR